MGISIAHSQEAQYEAYAGLLCFRHSNETPAVFAYRVLTDVSGARGCQQYLLLSDEVVTFAANGGLETG